MTEALSWLFARPELPRKWWQVIVWWELRRIPYNLIVGFAGYVTLIFMFYSADLSGGLKPGEDLVEPMALFFAPFIVNFFYTAGWVLELALRWMNKRDLGLSSTLYKIGIGFSLCVAELPSAACSLYWVARAVKCLIRRIG